MFRILDIFITIYYQLWYLLVSQHRNISRFKKRIKKIKLWYENLNKKMLEFGLSMLQLFFWLGKVPKTPWGGGCGIWRGLRPQLCTPPIFWVTHLHSPHFFGYPCTLPPFFWLPIYPPPIFWWPIYPPPIFWAKRLHPPISQKKYFCELYIFTFLDFWKE